LNFMDADLTQFQSPDEQERAEKLSREGNQPPADIPGYDIQVLVGSGAYGEVWSAIDRNTGRKVAIKFYSRRSAVDFSLLTREVEKLASLAADRYVVQLLDVGWDASPPFYVMDFIENGSLEDELRRCGTFSIEEAVEMFQEVAIGLMHLHNKGILHCDLKPGNVLLDTDQKPRLADFGQSRLSSEQAPALGTLFYMAPEQANLDAVPDARWDVFALGCLMYCMVTGAPPYRTDGITEQLESANELSERLRRYQIALKTANPPRAHRDIPEVDKSLADIIDRCIAPEPSKRFADVQSILLALRQREEVRARRPIMLLGLIGPILLLCIMSVFGFMLYNRSVDKATQSLSDKARESNNWAAQFASRTASEEINKFFSSVDQLAEDPEFLQVYKQVCADPKLKEILTKLADPNATEENLDLIEEFKKNPERELLQKPLQKKIDDINVKAASWFIDDAAGTQLAYVDKTGEIKTVGKNYSWRTYFSGLADDIKSDDSGSQPYPISNAISKRVHIEHSNLSTPFISQASQRWKVAFSAPIFDGDEFLGVIGATVHCSDLVTFPDKFDQYAMLVDLREGKNKGSIFVHPLFKTIEAENAPLPKSQKKMLPRKIVDIEPSDVPLTFLDPLAESESKYAGQWVMGIHEIERTIFDSIKSGLKSKKTGLYVLLLEKADSILKPVNDLGRQILILGLISVLTIVLVGVCLWFLAIRTAKDSRERVSRTFRSATETITLERSKSTYVKRDS